MKDNKTLIKESGVGLFKTGLVLAAIYGFKMSFQEAALLIIIVSAAITLWQTHRRAWPKGWLVDLSMSLLKLLIILTIIKFIYVAFGAYSILAFVLVTIGIASYILWVKREEYMALVRHAEKTVWGETAEERRSRRKKENERR